MRQSMPLKAHPKVKTSFSLVFCTVKLVSQQGQTFNFGVIKWRRMRRNDSIEVDYLVVYLINI